MIHHAPLFPVAHRALLVIAIASGGALGCDPSADVDDLPSLEEPDELEPGAEPEDEDHAEPSDDAGGVSRLPVEESTEGDEGGPGLVDVPDPQSDSWWGTWISEETPPTTCDGGTVARGVDCDGWSCDDVQLRCDPVAQAGGARSWSSWFSEEGADWRQCDDGAFVTGIACRGAWCDQMSIECTDLGIPHNNCQWTWHMGSDDPWYVAPSGYAITGLDCIGAYCNELQMRICQL